MKFSFLFKVFFWKKTKKFQWFVPRLDQKKNKNKKAKKKRRRGRGVRQHSKGRNVTGQWPLVAPGRANVSLYFLTYSLTFFLWPSFSLSIDTFLPGLPFFFLVCFSSLIGRPLDWFWKWFYDGRVSFYFYVFFSAFFFLFGTFLCHPSFRRPFDFTLFGSSFFFVLLVVGCAFPFLFFFCFFFFIFLKKFSAPSAGWGPFFVRHPDRIWLIDLFVTHTTYRRWTFAFLFGCRRKDRECFTGFYRVFFLHLVDIAQSDSGSYRVFFLMWSLLTRHFLRRNRVYRVCTEFFHFVWWELDWKSIFLVPNFRCTVNELRNRYFFFVQHQFYWLWIVPCHDKIDSYRYFVIIILIDFYWSFRLIPRLLADVDRLRMNVVFFYIRRKKQKKNASSLHHPFDDPPVRKKKKKKRKKNPTVGSGTTQKKKEK